MIRKAASVSAAGAVYAQTDVVFAKAVLFKPRSAEGGLASVFAPLMVLEENGRLAHLEKSLCCPGFPPAPAEPAMCAHVDSDQVRDGAHLEMTFVWCCGAAADKWTQPEAAQGLRIILNSAGEPVIWQVLSSGAVRVLFIAESLERAAAAQFGQTLPGRRYSIERSWDEQPNIVVARTIEDGPVPMGPMVYLKADTGAVTTVLCRCMPAQVRAVPESRTYRLFSVTTAGDLKCLDSVRPTDLENWLRLPSGW